LDKINLVLAGFLLIVYPVTNYLPQSWAWANGPIEWLQVFVLAFGAFLSYFYAKAALKKQKFDEVKFYKIIIPMLALMIGRELSWGRVLFVIEMTEKGPRLPSFEEIEYGFVVHPIIGVIIVVWLFYLYRYKTIYFVLNKIKSQNFPFMTTSITFIAGILAIYAERYLHNQLIEELAELLAYIGFVSTISLMRDKTAT